MEIYLVRHTTPDVLPGTCYGHSDVDVTETFLAEFDTLYHKLGHVRDPVIYSSPLQRCMKLAESVAITFSPQVSVQQDARLKELNFGDWEMQSWNDIPRGLVEVWAEDHVRHVPPNGESFLQLSQRVQAFVSDLDHAERPALVFTHAGVIRALTGYALDLPLIHTFKLQIDYASVSKIIIEDTVTRVAYVNR
ncbi:alpha-ribazole phosphatase [Methylobacillus arboreus]|uniref:alpha-ribazole phosphatase n=1 Tax=Methylobacillus arboreus TaxID=755170 RepID=UPI001E4A615D|nr:alpha-ribazole phosphatase [Methylobacillus arboreus]MCB5190100.1 alpha-ribazole phosphatase [Methylobacillus arboreus]